MIEEVEKLAVDAQLHVFAQREPASEVEIGPDEIGAAQGVAAEVAELAGLRGVAAGASAGGGIDGRDEGVGV